MKILCSKMSAVLQVLASALTVQAAATQEMLNYGWRGFGPEPEDRPLKCTVEKTLDSGVIFFAGLDHDYFFAVGLRSVDWSKETEVEYSGAAIVDDGDPVVLKGQSPDSQTLIFSYDDDDADLEGDFVKGNLLKVSFGSGTARVDLSGSGDARKFLERCYRT